MLPMKPDFIKVWYISGKEYPAEKTFPLVKYIASLCSKNNLKLAVHATELKTARLAVEAGASILEFTPDELNNITATISKIKIAGDRYAAPQTI